MKHTTPLVYLFLLILSKANSQNIQDYPACFNAVRLLKLEGNTTCNGSKGATHHLAQRYAWYQYSYLKTGIFDASIDSLINENYKDTTLPLYLITKADILMELGVKSDTTVYNLYVAAYEKAIAGRNVVEAC